MPDNGEPDIDADTGAPGSATACRAAIPRPITAAAAITPLERAVTPRRLKPHLRMAPRVPAALLTGRRHHPPAVWRKTGELWSSLARASPVDPRQPPAPDGPLCIASLLLRLHRPPPSPAATRGGLPPAAP